MQTFGSRRRPTSTTSPTATIAARSPCWSRTSRRPSLTACAASWSPGPTCWVIRSSLPSSYDSGAVAKRLKAFLERIETTARSHRNMTRLHRSAVFRPVEEFTESATGEVPWHAAFDKVRRLASRDTLGPLFLEVDPRMSSEADSTIVFAFSGYRFQNNAAWVDRFTRLMQPATA